MMEVYLPVSAGVVMERFTTARRNLAPKAQLIAATEDKKWFTGIVSHGFVYSLLKGHALADDSKTMIVIETHLHQLGVWLSGLTVVGVVAITLCSGHATFSTIVVLALSAVPLLSVPISKLVVSRFIHDTFLYDSSS